MSQRSSLTLATALTVFVAILTIGVVWQLIQKSTVAALAVQDSAPAQADDSAQPIQAAADPQTNNGPTLEQMAARQAQYEQLIEQANQRLAESYQAQQQLTQELEAQKQETQPPTPVPPAAPQPPQYAVSIDQANTIALTTEKGAKIVQPAELVSFQGTAAYEVTLDRGLIYIDAATGKVIYDSAAVIVVHDGGPSNSGGGGGGGNGTKTASPTTQTTTSHHEDEHEDGHSGGKQNNNGGNNSGSNNSKGQPSGGSKGTSHSNDD